MKTREKILIFVCAALIGGLTVQESVILRLQKGLSEAKDAFALPALVVQLPDEETLNSDDRADIVRLREELSATRAKLAAAEKRLNHPAGTAMAELTDTDDPLDTNPLTDAHLDKDEAAYLATFRTALKDALKLGLSAYSSPKIGELVKRAKEMGDDAILEIGAILLHGEDASQRFVAAVIYEKLADPASVVILDQALDSESDRLVRRMTSHAIAMIADDAGIEPLRKLKNDSDIGTRLNAAFGLAKVGAPNGLSDYQAFYDAPDTDAFMKTAMLGGFVLLKEPEAVPFLERVYSEADDLETKLVVVMALGKTPGAASANVLERIIASEPEDSVFDAAKAAYKETTGSNRED